MLNRSLSLELGLAFVLIGAINVWLILQASASVRDGQASRRLVSAHRVGGYLFIALYCILGYFMFARLGDSADAPATIIHITLAMVLSPLLFVKVLVARYYKNYYSVLMPLGLTIFVASFVLIGMTAGPSLVYRARLQTVSLETINLPPAAIDLEMASKTMERRCSKCHNLDRIAGARKDARGWLATVNRMKALPDSGIPEQDARIIVPYLASQMAPTGSLAAMTLEVGRALVDQKCGRCHTLDRVYKTTQTSGQWSATVTRMAAMAERSTNAFQPAEVQQIVSYLSATQTPEAATQRRSRTAAIEPAAAPQISKQEQAGTAEPYGMLGFLGIVCTGGLTLIIRRPGKIIPRPGKPLTARAEPAPHRNTIPAPATPLILKLASVTPQTHDARTLRFTVSDAGKLNARPGQFLTFSFLFDGKKVGRSYSICSSAARSGYVEITPKRVSEGCVSVFLNERATLGMTVEANGPYGQFFFDENKHRNIVLIAGGSGITPMMAMLRYIDDLCLETDVTLLYCVRRSDEIIFQSELDDLHKRLRNFHFHVLLSQPDAGSAGWRGRINREFIEANVEVSTTPDFFICGPAPFMETVRALLTELGVKPERVCQESFGKSQDAPREATGAQTGLAVEFARSGKVCTLREGQTLLQAAEEHGVPIPSSCRQGQCGTCRTRLLEGQVQMDAEVGLDPESRAQGFILACVGHARSSVKLDV
jgi:ferredoxin-NADP reductase/mono/diheme cytochrome c family protein